MSCSKCGQMVSEIPEVKIDPKDPIYPNRPCLFPGCTNVDANEETGGTYHGWCWNHMNQVDFNNNRKILDKWYADYYADLEKREPGKLKNDLEEGVRIMAYSYYSCDGFPYEYTYSNIYIAMDDGFIHLPGRKKYRIVLEEVEPEDVEDANVEDPKKSKQKK